MAKRTRYSPEVRERAVRLVAAQTVEHGSQWGAIRSVAEKIGCSPEGLRVFSEADSADMAEAADDGCLLAAFEIRGGPRRTWAAGS